MVMKFRIPRLANDARVKTFQAFAYIAAIGTLVFAWDWEMFLLSLGLGWLLFGFAGAICLHRMTAHKSFEPKNRFIKWVLLWFGTIATLGSTICWAAGHREHHKQSDHAADPHRPHGSLWHKIKMWFYYFPPWPINPLVVKDLLADKDHVFFHRHYFKMIFAFIVILGLINPILIGYVWALPVVYTLFGISWATTIAHIPQLGFLSWRQYDTDDYTYNSHFWNILLMGEGYHNTHHACPWLWNYALNKGEWDIAAWVVKLIGVPNDKPAKPFEAPRYGKALREELASVRERLAAKEPGHH